MLDFLRSRLGGSASAATAAGMRVVDAPRFDAASAFSACVDCTREYLTGHFGADVEVVLGISGGIDSALVATIASAALGPARVHGVFMEGPFSTFDAEVDADELAKNLGIDYFYISIDSAYDELVSVIETSDANVEIEDTIAGQNVQSRLRMTTLMALSNARGWYVLNAGNLTERVMGYSTLYGDGVGVYAPIGGLLKTQVWAMASWLNAHTQEAGLAASPLIPQRIIDKAPSAELAEGQTDEESLGITYEAMDRAICALAAKGELAGIAPAPCFAPAYAASMSAYSAGYSGVGSLGSAGLFGTFTRNAGGHSADEERVLEAWNAGAFKRSLAPACPVLS